MHNICYELFCDLENPDKFRADENLLAQIEERLAAVVNPDDKKVGSDWLDAVKVEVKKLSRTCDPNFLHLRRSQEFRGDYIPAVSEGVDNGLILAMLVINSQIMSQN